jgi:hypothetical protein
MKSHQGGLTDRQRRARAKRGARRRLSRFTNGGAAQGMAEVAGPREASGVAEAAEARGVQFVAVPEPLDEGGLPEVSTLRVPLFEPLAKRHRGS